MKLRDMSHAGQRRAFLEQQTATSLKHIGTFTVDEAVAGTRNCENMIGVVQVPLGVAGPLMINFQFSIFNSQKKSISKKRNLQSYYVPLATTEGALVASVNRGCRAITESGGAHVSVERIGVTRGSVFKREKSEWHAKEWLTKHFSQLQDIAHATSQHLTLLRYDVQETGKYAFIRWYFDTGDAMGMNMATIASQKLADTIGQQTGMRCVSVAGNYDVDKKPAWINSILGRGRTVRADVVIPKAIVASVLKTTPQKLEEVWRVKCMIGSGLSGSMGFNAHIANVVAALFIATGQDPAHVVEASQGMTVVEIDEDGLYCSVTLPALMVGTIGGGTGLATQSEALQLLNCCGEGKSDEFAGVVAGAVLAGELSLLASLTEGSLARAHMKRAR